MGLAICASVTTTGFVTGVGEATGLAVGEGEAGEPVAWPLAEGLPEEAAEVDGLLGLPAVTVATADEVDVFGRATALPLDDDDRLAGGAEPPADSELGCAWLAEQAVRSRTNTIAANDARFDVPLELTQ